MHRIRAVAIAVAAAFVSASAAQASAQVIQAVPHVIQAVPRGGTTPVPNLGARADHAVYGTIVAANGALLTVRLRTGRLLKVDASEAVRRGTYSAPLFVGKSVVAEGSLGTGNVLYAIRVTRMEHTASAPPDR